MPRECPPACRSELAGAGTDSTRPHRFHSSRFQSEGTTVFRQTVGGNRALLKKGEIDCVGQGLLCGSPFCCDTQRKECPTFCTHAAKLCQMAVRPKGIRTCWITIRNTLAQSVTR
jgi:hypothetical protein